MSKLIFLVVVFSNFILAETVYTTQIEINDAIILLQGKWNSMILEFCEEDSTSLVEELQCKKDTSEVKVIHNVKRKK